MTAVWPALARLVRVLSRRLGRGGGTTLPGRLLDVPLIPPSGREAALGRERLEMMVDAYHLARGQTLPDHATTLRS